MKYNRNQEKCGPGKYFCLMGGLHIEMCILAILGELIDGSGLYKILSTSNMSITGTQNLLTDSHVKTTRYCIEVAASAIYLKLTQSSPMCNYGKMILGLQLKILLYVRSLYESNF